MSAGYSGAKAAAGVYQRIINQMPPHLVYCEPFVGGGSILRARRDRARACIVMDRDADVAARWERTARVGMLGGRAIALTAHQGDALYLIAGYGERIHAGWLIYADPPYVRSARRSAAPLYRHEFGDEEHRVLIALLRSLPALVMISGYRCELYEELLPDWRRVDYQVMTHAGITTESLWCNFPEPAERAEYTFIGANFRERERIKRKKARWCRRIAAMDAPERNAVMQALLEVCSSSLAAPGDASSRISTAAGDRPSPVAARPAAARMPAPLVTAGDGAGEIERIFDAELARVRERDERQARQLLRQVARSRIAESGGEDLTSPRGGGPSPITGGGGSLGEPPQQENATAPPPIARDPCPVD